MEPLLLTLLFWISEHSFLSYHKDMALPEFRQLEHDQLVEMYMDKNNIAYSFLSDEYKEMMYKNLSASLEAIFIAEEDAIYISDRIDINSTYGQSIIVHELIHFLQNKRNHIAQVPCLNALEKDAYTIQARYLEAHNQPVPFDTFTIHMLSQCERGF